MAKLIRTQDRRIENLITIVDAPPPEQLYFGSSRRDALKELWFGLSSGEIGLLTGEAGLGKTLLCRELLRRLPTAVLSVYLVAPKNEQALMDNVLQSVAMIRQLHKTLEPDEIDAAELFSRWAIIVDEAQRLGVATLRKLAEWRDAEIAQGRSVGLLLVGLPALERTLTVAELSAFDSRITTRCELPVFPRAETEAYINHWLQQQWPGSRMNFSESANRVVHFATGGIPLQINRVCTRALDSARLHQQASVTAFDAMRAALRVSATKRDDSNDDSSIFYAPMPMNDDTSDDDAYPKTVRLSDLYKH